MHIPTDAIDADALIRGRTHLDRGHTSELQAPIAANDLRQPIEVFHTESGFALISDYRRLLAVRELHRLTGDDAYASIAATVRDPMTEAGALVAMDEEYEQRKPLSPWERARIA